MLNLILQYARRDRYIHLEVINQEIAVIQDILKRLELEQKNKF